MALRTPQGRGQWGQSTLRRVVELVGMIEHCDFTEQTSITTEGALLRPDMIVHLPNQRQVVVDAKAPSLWWEDYLQADKAESEDLRETALNLLAKHIRELSEISGKVLLVFTFRRDRICSSVPSRGTALSCSFKAGPRIT
jgi:DNA recombination protein RmuC